MKGAPLGVSLTAVPLRLAQLVADTEAEGPGKRFAIWVQGCTLRCPGCCNPEMFGTDRGQHVDPVALAQQAKDAGVEGVSILGGEPFEQPLEVAQFAEAAHAHGLSVMVYSGFTLEELHAKNDPSVTRLLAAIDVLCDGRFMRELPETRRRWLGSSNQRLHFLTSRGEADRPRFDAPNTVELRLTADGLTINGWPALADAFRRSPR